MCTSGVGPSVQHLGRSTQRSLSRQEHSSSTQLIPHFGARSRVNRSWGSSKQRNARSQEEAKPSSFLELQCQAVVWDKHNGERDTNFDWLWTEPQMQSLWTLVHFDHMGPTCFSAHLPGDRAHEGNGSLVNLTLRDSTLKTGEEIPPSTGLWQPWSKKETPSIIQCRLWLLYHHTFYKGDKNQHMLRKEVAGIHTKTALALKTLDSHGLRRDIPTLKHPFKTTVDNCFP